LAVVVDPVLMSARVPTNTVFEDGLAAIAPVVDLDSVQSTGRVTELLIGNGLVMTEYLADLLVQAQTEVLFATCFWASSPSLSRLHDALLALNERAGRDSRRVTVKIMFSSYSFRQKFLSLKGTRIWRPSTWTQLGLPAADMLDSLDVTVFSRFKKPFGIMHAKFLVIDRSSVILPSSNISCTASLYHL
jgi:phosphatidylserine/phosphatidylglycerophosphate/cardiolipin synthase-like enzyme